MNPKFPNKRALFHCLIVDFVITASAAGQAGKLDPTFGNGGIATQQAVVQQTTNVYSVGGVAIQGDGKIVVAGGIPGNNGFTVSAVLRFLPTGGLDHSFGAMGIAVLPNSFGGYAALAIQPDGKILAGTSGGGPNAEVDRFTTVGLPDPSFGVNGRVSFSFTSFSGLALQPDGRIVVALEPFISAVSSEVTRLLANGGTDTSFGTDGIAIPPGGTGPLQVLPSGEILVFGGLISRLTSTGALDTEFGVNGQLLAQSGSHALAANGDILVGSALVSDPTVPSTGFTAFGYRAAGIGDPAFGNNGGVFTPPLSGFPRTTPVAMGLQSNGDIVELASVANNTSGAFGLVRYTPAGQLDRSFGSGGTVTTSLGTNNTPVASAIAIQFDDKIVVAGTVFAFLPHDQFSTALVVGRYLGK